MLQTSSGQERRLTFQLLAHWQEMQSHERRWPSLDDLALDAQPGLHDFTFVIDVIHESPAYYRFAYFGPSLVDIFDKDYTKEPVVEAFVDNDRLKHSIGFFHEAKTSGEPVSESSSFPVQEKQAYYRSLVVPTSSDGQEIDYLVGTANYKVK